MQTQASTKLQIQWLVEKRWKRVAWLLAALLVGGYIAYTAREIWLPIGIAFLIAMVLDPVVDRLEHRGWSRTWGAALIFGSFLLVLGTSLFFAVPALVHQGEEIGGQFDRYMPARDAKSGQIDPVAFDTKLQHQGVQKSARALIVQAAQQLDATVRSSGAWISQTGMKIASNMIWLVIIPIVAFYALKDFHLILAKTLLVVPKHNREMVQTMVAEVSVIFAKYMRGLMTVSLLNGLATWGLLTLFGVPNALLLGCIAGLLYSVPYLGALITIVLVAAVSFLSKGTEFTLMVVGANVVLHQIVFDQIISPRILGGHVGLHPILSILALLIGNALLGIVGMVLAVPIAASIQVAVLTMVPKLNQEIDLTATASASAAADSALTKVEDYATSPSDEATVSVNVTEELHKGVSEAVAQVEAQVEEDEATAAAEADLAAQAEEEPPSEK
jgi:predicted PurR-regulated permease PerM